MNPTIIIQARMTSTRLPGKVIKKVLGKPLLEYQIERLLKVKGIHAVVVATTTLLSDDPVVDLCKKLGVSFYRGSEEDVLGRYYECALQFKADPIVRVTADCPLIDPDVIEACLQVYQNEGSEYASNIVERTYPRGLDAEIFSFSVLKKLNSDAKLKSEREHVTLSLLNHRKLYRVSSYVCPTGNFSQHRWTVDTAEDFELIQKILTEIMPSQPDFRMQDILNVLQAHPEWSQINAHVEQKKV